MNWFFNGDTNYDFDTVEILAREKLSVLSYKIGYQILARRNFSDFESYNYKLQAGRIVSYTQF